MISGVSSKFFEIFLIFDVSYSSKSLTNAIFSRESFPFSFNNFKRVLCVKSLRGFMYLVRSNILNEF